MKINQRQHKIIRIIESNADSSISVIKKNLLDEKVSIPTLNRDLALLVRMEILIKSGKGRNIVYRVSPQHQLLNEETGDSYFNIEIDKRKGKENFDPAIFSLLQNNFLFTEKENIYLENLYNTYRKKIATLTPVLLKKETERLSIDLSWKSSQIEGNTYSLLETELLLLERQLAKNKDQSEAVMLLNHKKAIDFIYQKRITFTPLKVSSVEDIHSLLVKDLGVSRNLRKRRVGITGTTYTPPDNEFQIKKYLERSCEVINKKKSVFEKALLCILMISYIQPFEDGNKRSGRITANGILIENGYCPLSYRSVQPLDYKKAIIIFYEQNNISAFKRLFIDQAEFAVKNYF